MKKMKFGLIGLGKITRRFARVLNTMPQAELTSVASREISRTQAFASEFHAKKAAASYKDLIDDPDVDVIYIGLTHNLHFEIAKKCLEAQKPVLCEKPLVTTRRDAEELVELAKQNQTFLMEALWTRCMPAFLKAREWVAAGKIGQVKLITANFCYRAPFDPNNRIYSQETAGGSLYDVGIYVIDFAMGILSEHPQSVSGSSLIAPNGVDESAAFSMRFESGALANLACGFNVRAMDEAVIYGTKGRIVLNNCFGPKNCIRYNENNWPVEWFYKPVADGFIYQIRHTIDLLHQGKIESDLIPWQDSIVSAGIFDTLLGQWGIK
jgi:predicted dehydrogenase